jgi:predicted ATP-dependent serine protease
LTNSTDPLTFRWNIPNDLEFNTVLGGGLVPGSLILLGGDPGT